MGQPCWAVPTDARLDRDRLARLMAGEMARFAEEHPRSATLHARARGSLLEGVPMPWMVKWAGPFPPYVESAEGAHFRCVDGHDYVDFCLGDTGAMAGHGPAPTIAAVERQIAARHHPYAPDRGRGLGRRGADPPVRRRVVAVRPLGQRCQPLGPAPRPRMITGRSKVVVHDHCYHGSVDEAIAMLGPDGTVVPVRGSVGPQVDVAQTTRVVEFNDVDGLEAALADGDVAAVLFEPALTNVGIVLPGAGLPRRRPRDHPPDRDAPGHRRDPHHLRRARRRDRRVGSRAGHRRHRQDDRRRHPVGGVRLQPGGRGPHRAARSRSRTRTSAGSAARWPATRCRWPRPGPRSARS